MGKAVKKIAPKNVRLCPKCPAEQLELEPARFTFLGGPGAKKSSKKTTINVVDLKKKSKEGLF